MLREDCAFWLLHKQCHENEYRTEKGSPEGTYIVLVLVSEALVRVKDGDRDAHAALVAVPEGLNAADAAEAAQIAMERLLRHGHPQVANVAVVLPEHCLAVRALVAVQQRKRFSK
jgi:hypothetical protein